MRLHSLALDHFGPFRDLVTIDLDDLASSGIFLVTGPTGAGKTSLLDGICYALFADVPGERPKSSVRCDHGATDLPARVVLEFSVAERRLRITRTSEFERPKRRGTGCRAMPATVLLEQWRAGQWEPISTRIDEVAEEVHQVVGLGLAQFAKVIVLPQGDFAAFLHASADERRQVLERLFDISDFTAIERWFADERRRSAQHVAELWQPVRISVARLADALGDSGHEVPLPVGRDPLPAELEDLPDALAALLERLEHEASTALVAADAAEGDERLAIAALHAAENLANFRDKGSQAAAELSALTAQEPKITAAREELLHAERADRLRGFVKAVDDAADFVDRTRKARDRAAAAVGPVDCVIEDVTAHDDGIDQLVQVSSVLAEAERTQVHQLQVQRELDQVAARAEAALHARLVAHQSAAEAASLHARRQDLRSELAAHDALSQATVRASLTAEAARDARDRAQDARDRLLNLQQARLDGMAGELAADLSDGQPCPVCGAAEHPQPAVGGQSPDAQAIAAAAAAAESAQQAYDQAARDAAGAAALAQERRSMVRLGGDPDAAAQALAEIDSRLAELSTTAADRDEADGVVDRAAAALNEARQALAAADSAVTTHRALLAAGREAVAQARNESVRLGADHAALCPCGEADPALLPARHRTFARLVDQARERAEASEAATARWEEAWAALADEMAAAGFDSVDQVRAALRPRSTMAELVTLLADHDQHVARCRTVLADPQVAAAVAQPEPDLPGASAHLAAMRHRRSVATTARSSTERCLSEVQQLSPVFVEQARELALAVDRSARVRQLADLVTGTSSENTLRMQLTAYVLAARLESVVDAANERLSVMGGGRYRLLHSDARAARGARGGLGLLVLDQWTGLEREPTTLSGGESFMASLALALGLADAVRADAGGVDLGTLFVDEGFGTLDDETLDEVLGVLDGLRNGGRIVGVISHVRDLRQRIPDRVHVTKSTDGSQVTVRHAPSLAG